jgi:hypothetical protein
MGAMAPTFVLPGQSGFAVVSASTAILEAGADIAAKGHMNFVATGEIKTPADAQVQLESLAHLEEEDSNQTATMYAHFGYDPLKGIGINPNWAIGPTWSQSDTKPPSVAQIDDKGDFTMTGLKNLSKPCVTLNVAYGFNHVSTPIDRNHLDYKYDVTMNMNPSWIAGLKSGVDISLLKDSYMNEGAINGVKYSGIPWRTPFSEAPVVFNGQISDDRYNRVSWEDPIKHFMVYGELNPGILPDPAPGLRPEDWPHRDAYPGPVLRLPGSWLEE